MPGTVLGTLHYFHSWPTSHSTYENIHFSDKETDTGRLNDKENDKAKCLFFVLHHATGFFLAIDSYRN